MKFKFTFCNSIPLHQHAAIPMDTDKEIFKDTISNIVDDLPSGVACFLLASDNVSVEGIAAIIAVMQSEHQICVATIGCAPSVRVPHCISMPMQFNFSREANIWDTEDLTLSVDTKRYSDENAGNFPGPLAATIVFKRQFLMLLMPSLYQERHY